MEVEPGDGRPLPPAVGWTLSLLGPRSLALEIQLQEAESGPRSRSDRHQCGPEPVDSVAFFSLWASH